MKIVILTLSGQRDELIDNMLAEELCKYQHEAVVRSFIMAGRESVIYDQPDIVIHPMAGGEYKIDLLRKCRQWGVRNLVRRGEAGMGRVEFEKMSSDRKKIMLGNWDYGPYVDLELVWGQEFGDIIAEQGHMPAEKIKACGAFPFDPYFSKDYHRNRSRMNRKKAVLFATGFSTCDCRSDYCELGLEEDAEYHKDIYKKHRAARDIWIEAITEFAKWFDNDWDIYLKVRPGEITDEYEKSLPDSVTIFPQFSPSSEVLEKVDVLVHSGSTMAVEAHLMRIPSFNFCNVNPDPVVAALSPAIEPENYRGLEWFVTRATLDQSNIDIEKLRVLEDHLYGIIDGKACENAARHIDRWISSLDRPIKTNIPGKWPLEVLYHEDKERVHLTRQKGDASWLCPACRNQYFAKPCGIARCPYCGMHIEMEQKVKSDGGKTGLYVRGPILKPERTVLK